MRIIKENDKDAIDLAIQFLSQGNIIAFATDTIYGFGVDASNIKAVESLYKIKNRDQKKPIAIFVKDLETAKKIFYFDKLTTKIAKKFLPGSLTLVVKKSNESSVLLAKNLNQNNDEFLGFRIVEKKFIQNLLNKFNGILAVTSANISTQEPINNPREIKKYFSDSELALLIEGDVSKTKLASTVVKISEEKMIILRHGIITESELKNL